MDESQVYPNAPVYPVYRAIASYDENYDAEVVGESEILGNIFNQVGKALDRGASRVTIERTNQYVDARVPQP